MNMIQIRELSLRRFRSRMTSFLLVVALVLSGFSVSASAQALVSGEPIRVGTGDGSGPFSPPGISCTPLGAVNITGGEREDLFVFSDRWYPGLLLYTYAGQTDNGVPIFAREPIRLKTSFSQNRPIPGAVFRHVDGTVYGVWAEKQTLLITTYDAANHAFIDQGRVKIAGIKYTPGAIHCRARADGQVDVFLSVPDGKTYRPGGSHRSPDYRPYRPDGIWNGNLHRQAIYRLRLKGDDLTESQAGLVLPAEQGGLLGIAGITAVGDDLIYGTTLGGLYALRDVLTQHDSRSPASKSPVTSADGVSLRVPGTWGAVAAYPSADGEATDLIIACEGGVYYYQSTESKHSGGLAFELIGNVQQRHADLHGGTLVVPVMTDWNGDGAMDIVAGNSQGFLLFLENAGTNGQPRFAPAQRLEAGGEPVQVQGGYRSIQGPGEARWGYTCPIVIDWNGDGTLDILTNDINGQHLLYKNIGTTTEPVLDRGRTLYLDDLPMHGTWRTRPAAGMLDGRMAYITLDDDDHFHLYWQVDERNIEDGGKLLLEDGNVINANFLEAGGTGRTKFMLADLDGDGETDLLLGTPRHGSIPDPEHGLPKSLGLPGAAVLFMRNTGSDAAPSFARPKLMHFKGEPVYFGQHSCAPAVAPIGDAGGPNILVGDEHGRLTWFSHKDITWEVPE